MDIHDIQMSIILFKNQNGHPHGYPHGYPLQPILFDPNYFDPNFF